jgi:hypothetical protein
MWVCVASTWPHEESASHSRTCRAEPHRPHTHASTRVCIGTSYHTRAQMHMRGVHTYHMSDPCMPMHTGGHTHTHTMSPGTSSARAVARTVHMDAMQPRCTLTAYSSHKHPSIYRDRTRLSLQIDTQTYTPTWRDLHARARSYAQAFVATHLYVLHVSTGGAYKDDDLYIHAFAYI